jgi:hypothetical protein
VRRLSTDSDLGRRSALPENSAGRERLRLSQDRAGRDVNVTSLQSRAAPHLLSVVLESVWTTMLQNCLNVSGGLFMVRAPCHFIHCAVPSSMLSPVGFNMVGRKCLENALGLVYHWQLMILAGVRAYQPCRPSMVMQRAGAPTFSPRLSRWSNRPWNTYNLDSVRLAQSPVKPLLHRFTGEQAIFGLKEATRQTKLHPTTIDGNPTSQIKFGNVKLWRALMGEGL